MGGQRLLLIAIFALVALAAHGFTTAPAFFKGTLSTCLVGVELKLGQELLNSGVLSSNTMTVWSSLWKMLLYDCLLTFLWINFLFP